MKLLKPKQVMEVTGLGQAATYQLLHSEGFPLIILNKNALRVDEKDLYDYLRKRKINNHRLS